MAERTGERSGEDGRQDGRAGRVVRRELGIGGTVVAVAFLCASLSPSLLPRPWTLQGVVAGIAAAAGYGLGSIISAVLRRGFGLTPSPRARDVAWRLLAALGTVVSLSVLWFSADWQREIRISVGMSPDIAWFTPLIAVVAAVTFAALLTLSRAMRLGTRKLIGLLGRFVPVVVAKIVGLGVAVFLVLVFANDVLFANFVEVMNNTSSLANVSTSPGIHPPSSGLLSGGPGSLVSWKSLGRTGRDLIGTTPSKAGISAFAGRPAKDPIRVYVGLQSADTLEQEAALAVRELERTGAFDREVLAVMGTTGSGWVDPAGADSLEYMYAGDTAMVAMQYSYLPSWLSFVVDRGKAARAGEALVRAVEAKMATLPAAGRPKLLVFGESLGAYFIEEGFGADLQTLLARTDGALLVGPPNANPIWRDIVAHRDPGSPEWRPVYRGGRQVLFGQTPADLLTSHRPGLVYLQNASDPVVWWNPSLLWRKPAWLDEPRGPDVAPAMRWYPVVTFWQVVVDLTIALNVPDGHGHRYGPNVVNGWATVAPPDGWTQADTDRLRTLISVR
ncbi:alpha/beta-hydrolase family protein [Spongiactinospora sp. TRM90649]|uniref:alpha/beta hydrolase n=1 Tax=Spongiactinospora sp. TRM90649 TaxID=3031114 RepID=UPI0023F875AE|nr:alpha/beta-hydrolase family protein [Spongiactinospora sp. TRM90649]MDF5752489.1 alpha/beta-hydrolase family protein [Spongiactinospora sp. TRM90649]